MEGKKSQSTNEEEENVSAVRSWTTRNQNFIQAQSLLTHVLSNIFGYLDRKASKEKNIMAEEDLNNNIILDVGLPIDIFRNIQLVTYINRGNKFIPLYTNVGSKINQM